ncbi:uncharacterized protein [Dendrobates tinctorius]|uniref:uncharacterized protein n=1 Tax=Dendrobates tinctorius TaxID=92724 RepID=UPI003CC9DA64
MATVMAILHTRGVVVLPYLDNLLIKGLSLPACKESVDITVNTLSRLGWQIKKSFPKPAQQISFLGMILNTSRGLVILPPVKTLALQQAARTFSRPTSHTIRFSMRVLGKLVAAIEAVPIAQFHLRPLQYALLLAWDKNPFSLDRRFLLSVPAGHISPQVVDTEVLPKSREVFFPSKMVSSNHRRKSSRLGCGLSSPHGTGLLVNSRVTSPHQHFGDTSDQVSSMEFPPSPRRSTHQDPIRQRQDCSVYQPPGRYSEQDGHARSESHPPLGRDQPFAHLSNPHPGRKELGGRFSQSPRPCRGRVVSSSGSLSADLLSLGDSGCGYHGLKTKQQGSSIHCPIA